MRLKPVKPIKLKVKSESQEQAEIVQWWQVKSRQLGLFESALLHIPNEGAFKLKRLGVRPGVPDLLLCVPSGQFHGLWIELKKTKGGIVSAEQVDFLTFLKAMGFAAYCCKGAQAAKKLIETYLKDPESLPDRALLFN